jgi:hypothetical protein
MGRRCKPRKDGPPAGGQPHTWVAKKLALNPFDQTILASILVRAEQLVSDGATDLAFCELDSDLQPWDKRNNRKDELADLYDRARVWVYGDFLLETPAIPADWPPAN